METWQIVLIWVVVIAAIGVGLYFWGKKLQKRYDEQQQLVNQHKQVVPLFIIDKKKDKLENLKLPKQVKDQVPKMQRKRKMPVVIAKAGPQIVTLMCDEIVYNTVPVKKQIHELYDPIIFFYIFNFSNYFLCNIAIKSLKFQNQYRNHYMNMIFYIRKESVCRIYCLSITLEHI